jgi:glycosyltransferase involved in cell wall biosynthesis
MCSKNEGLGRVTAEAMLAGCPVIAHASGGTLDLIRHNDTGYLFNTIDECAHLIQHVVTSNQDKTIDNALLFANENFLEESYGKKVLDIYKRTLSH